MSLSVCGSDTQSGSLILYVSCRQHTTEYAKDVYTSWGLTSVGAITESTYIFRHKICPAFSNLSRKMQLRDHQLCQGRVFTSYYFIKICAKCSFQSPCNMKWSIFVYIVLYSKNMSWHFATTLMRQRRIYTSLLHLVTIYGTQIEKYLISTIIMPVYW